MSSVDPQIERNVGHDIGPDEIWGRHPQESRYHTVDMLVSGGDGMQCEYETVYVENHRYTDPSPNRPWRADCEFVPMYDEANRLRTFDNLWLSTFHVTKEDCAKNGFFYVGPYDKVKCAFCLKTLYGWEEGDTVEGEHQTHYPTCPFVMGQCFSSNRPINIQVRPDVSNTINHRTKPAAKFPEYEDRLARLKTFENWRFTTVSANKLVDAGFFYTGPGDNTKCFYCGKIISEWENGDDPFQEHLRWYPNCQFIQEISKALQQSPGSIEMTDVQCTEPSQTLLERDLCSPAAVAVLEHGMMGHEELTAVLQQLRLVKGNTCQLTSKDILNFEMDKKE